MPVTYVTPDRDDNLKNMRNVTNELNTDSDFGIGVVTGNQEIENSFWDKLCAIVLCCSCGGGGGGATQMKKVD